MMRARGVAVTTSRIGSVSITTDYAIAAVEPVPRSVQAGGCGWDDAVDETRARRRVEAGSATGAVDCAGSGDRGTRGLGGPLRAEPVVVDARRESDCRRDWPGPDLDRSHGSEPGLD